jgi:CRISPR/Cas system-associated endonuclease Cas3-HD
MQTPSYKDNSTLKGCLIAHVALTLIEMQQIASYFKKSLYRIFTVSRVGKGIELTESDFWDVLLSTSFLHDVGKLTDQYVGHTYPSEICDLYKKPMNRHISTEKHVRHHQVSAVITRKTLRKVLLDDDVALKMAYAVLFHHEAIDWKAVEQSVLLSSYLQVTLSPLSQVSYTIAHDRLFLFEQNLCKILNQMQTKNIITQLQCSFLVKTFDSAINELKDNQGATLRMDRELDVEKVKEPKYIMPALALYRFIYLTDNRAASARSEYWLKIIQQVNWSELEKVAQQIQCRLTRRYYYIGLSAIPEEFLRRFWRESI